MRNTILAFLVILFFAVTLNSSPATVTEEEKAAIKSAAANYIEGWFEGNADRMDKALHENLTKRTPITDRKTGKSQLRILTKTQMVEYTQKGGGKNVPKEKLGIKIDILDVYRNIATVRSECLLFIDYLHLAKMDGKWQIVNVLWEGVKKDRKEIAVDPKIFQKYVGEYELKPDFIITVSTETNKIFIQATNQPKVEVFPESKEKFFLKVTEAQVTFVKGNEGKITHLILHQGGREMKATKIK